MTLSDRAQAEPFSLTSPAFEEGREIPRRHSCDGDDVSPPLEWTGAPPDTASFALVMDDPDARGFVHWVVFDIPASATGSLPAGWASTAEAPQGTNGFGRVGYGGPCPPSGSHRYAFRFLALDALLLLQGAPRATEVLGAAEGHTLAEARLTGTYARST